MKRLAIVVLFLWITAGLRAQIILESNYSYSASYTKLVISGYKYFLMDVGLNQCRIYNLNHTLWKTIPLNVPSGHYLYDIKYVSENLFTNDNSLSLAYIYYNYNSTGQYYTYTLKVIKENGTELLTVPGCQYVYIYNLTGIGTKMFTYSFDYSVWPYTVLTGIYSLPGELLTSNRQDTGNEEKLLHAFPNPAADFVTIPIENPHQHSNAKIVIFNSTGDRITTFEAEKGAAQVIIPVRQFPKGIYVYQIDNEGFHNFGKFIVN